MPSEIQHTMLSRPTTLQSGVHNRRGTHQHYLGWLAAQRGRQQDARMQSQLPHWEEPKREGRLS